MSIQTSMTRRKRRQSCEASTSASEEKKKGGEASVSASHRYTSSFSFDVTLHLFWCQGRKRGQVRHLCVLALLLNPRMVASSNGAMDLRKQRWATRKRETLRAILVNWCACFKLLSFSRCVNDMYVLVMTVWSLTCFWINFTHDRMWFNRMVRTDHRTKWRHEEYRFDGERDNKPSSSFLLTFDAVIVGGEYKKDGDDKYDE